jgi:hypothetical protein
MASIVPIREINSPNATVCVNLNPNSLHVVRSVGPASEIGQIELNLVPAFVQTHRHGANKRLHSRCGLIIRGSKPPLYTFIIENLYLKREILVKILNDHHKERKLDTQCLLRIRGTYDVTCRNIGAHNF